MQRTRILIRGERKSTCLWIVKYEAANPSLSLGIVALTLSLAHSNPDRYIAQYQFFRRIARRRFSVVNEFEALRRYISLVIEENTDTRYKLPANIRKGTDGGGKVAAERYVHQGVWVLTYNTESTVDGFVSLTGRRGE